MGTGEEELEDGTDGWMRLTKLSLLAYPSHFSPGRFIQGLNLWTCYELVAEKSPFKTPSSQKVQK